MSCIEDKLKEIHQNDREQLDIIFSQEKRILVEASAGCGKTKTLVSKIAYLLSTNKIPVNKKILILTFGVNAAYKIKKEVFENVPKLIRNIHDLEDKIIVTNFHGFSRRILSRYGYLLNDNLLQLNQFSIDDDAETDELTQLDIGLLMSEADFLSTYSQCIKDNNYGYLNENFEKYIALIKYKFLPNNHITYNAILLLTLKLLSQYSGILQFYQKLFPYIIIDEFQDTGSISWAILRQLITEKTSLLFMGDPLQRIYGFIGAVPGLMEKACAKYSMNIFKITTNYRFKDNPNMLQLDKNIRENSKGNSIIITQNAVVPCNLYYTQHDEAVYIKSKLIYLLNHYQGCKIAILIQSRTKNLNYILDYLASNSIDYFNGLFNEESYSYKKFHKDVLEIFIDSYNKSKLKTIRKSFLSQIYEKVSAFYDAHMTDEISSLIKLLKVFFSDITNKIYLNNEEKYQLIIDVLSNNSLKQSMELLEEKIVVTTVHGAKGLEWDYILLPDMERNSFPNWQSLCSVCPEIANHDGCNRCSNKSSNMDQKFYCRYIDILSLFYVAVTRARKQVFFSASLQTLNNPKYPRTKISCLLSLPGIDLKEDKEI